MLLQLQYWARSVRAGQSFRGLFSPGLTSSGTCIPCAASNATVRGSVFGPPGTERDLIRPNSLWARNLRTLRRMRLLGARACLAVTHFSFQRSIEMRTPANIAKHPIHPMLIPMPIGLWIFSLVCDLIHAAGSAMAHCGALHDGRRHRGRPRSRGARPLGAPVGTSSSAIRGHDDSRQCKEITP
jgi:hypothetical protein